MRTTIAAAAVLLAASPALSQDAGPAPDANLFIYRDYAEPTIWAPTVKIDGKKVVALGQNQYTAIRLAPGEHRISLAWPLLSGQSGKAGKIIVAEGKPMYLELVGTSRVSGFNSNGYTFLMGSGLELRGDSAADAIAKCCKFKPPKN